MSRDSSVLYTLSFTFPPPYVVGTVIIALILHMRNLRLRK